MLLKALKSKTVWLALLQLVVGVLAYAYNYMGVELLGTVVIKSLVDLGLRSVTVKSLRDK